MVRFLSLLFLLRASTLADASAMILESRCADIIFPDGDQDDSCFSVMIIGPSIALTTLPNGTEVTEYVGIYSVSYNYEEGNAGLVTEVSWEQDAEETNVCTATAAGEVCLVCTLCPDGTVSADCTNLAEGRSVLCGESPLRGLGFGEEDPYCNVAEGVSEACNPFYPFSSTYVYDAADGTGGDGAAPTAPSGSPAASPVEKEIAGVASPANTILHEEATDEFATETRAIKIKSDVPVTVQRFVDATGYLIGAYPIYYGKGAVLVTSDCDTSETTVVPDVSIASEGGATFVTVTLGVDEGGASGMPFLESSSYQMVYTMNSLETFYAEDIQPGDPIVRYVTCMTEAECRAAAGDYSSIKFFLVGEYPTSGCFYKNDRAYWGLGGDPAESVTGIQQRIMCPEFYFIDDVVVDSEGDDIDDVAVDSEGGACTTQDQCNQKRSELGIASFVPGTFPTKGCFSKMGVYGLVAYWSEGGTAEEISRSELPGIQERITCGGGATTTAVVSESQAIDYPEYIVMEESERAKSSAFSVKSCVLGSILNNVVSSQVAKSPTPRSRLLQDTCTYNVEVLVSGCDGYDAYSQIEVAAPKGRVLNSVIELAETETVYFYEISDGLYGKEVKNTVTVTFPDDQEQLIDVASDTYASVPDPLLEEGTCAPIAIGRPFIDSDGHSLVASTIFSNECGETSSWLGETSAFAHEAESMESVANMTNQLSLGEKWARNALGEHASVASFAAFSVALMTNHAPSDLVEDSLKAALDEVRHAKTSFAIASELLGKGVSPGPLPPSNHQFNRDLTALAISVAKEGCIDETLSALAAAAEVELIDEVLEKGAAVGTKYYGIAAERLVWIRDELRTISTDEGNHSALAWRTLDWVCRVDARACGAARQSVLEETKLIDAFQRRFGRNLEHSPELSDRMMMAWRSIYSGGVVPPVLI